LVSQRAEAPEIISTNSIVILACLALLYLRVSLSKISPAFLDAFCIAFILADCSEQAQFRKATQRFEVKYRSYRAMFEVFLSGSVWL